MRSKAEEDVKRRGNGEGTIRQRTDGRWEGRALQADGRPKSVYARTRAEVVEMLRALLNARAGGTVVASDKSRVDAYLREWLDSARPSLKASTWRRYEELVRVHAIPIIGAVSLVRLTPQHVQAMYGRLGSAGVGAMTIHHLHAVLRRALGQAELWGTIPRNPVRLASPPRVTRHEMTTLTEDQVATFLDAVRGKPREALYLVAVTTGMRQGEILALRWSDVDLTRGVLAVQSVIEMRDGRVTFVEPKTRTSRRRVTLTPPALAALARHKREQAEIRMSAGQGAWQDHGLVFPDDLGHPQHGDTVTHAFQMILARAGLPRIRFHDLRHTAATLLLGRNVHPKIVSGMLGHSTIAITLDLYSHVTPAMERDAAAVMAQVIGAGSQ